MLTEQNLSLSVLEKILDEFDLEKIKKTEPLATSGNITFLIDAVPKKYILRLSPEGDRWRSKEEILAEIELVDYLAEHNFSVSRAKPKKDGQKIVEWENKFGYLREFIGGEFISNPNFEQIEKFGEKFGYFHKLTQGYKTKYEREHNWGVEETKKYFQEKRNYILKSNFKESEQFIIKIEKELSLLNFPEELPKGMLHEDLGKRHVIWQNDKINGIIDFDRCYYGHLILDLGQILRGWCFTDNWQNWSEEIFEILINSYQKNRELINLEKDFLFAAVRFAIIERAISFCFRFIDLQDSEDEDFIWHSINHQLEIIKKAGEGF